MRFLPMIAGFSALAAAAPAELDTRASCTFTDAKTAMSKKTSCTDIVLNNVKVPAGETLDLTGLKDGTKVTFQGTTTFGYKEWEGPLISVGGKKIIVTGASGSLISCEGERWWDGKGGNGGKKKPKFFKVKMNDGTINGLKIKNTPVHGFSISGVTNLKVNNVEINNKDGDSKGGHNTDAFDVGQSTGVTISGAKVYNQDDCLAINSGTNIVFENGYCYGSHGLSIGSVGGRTDNTVKNIVIRDSTIEKADNGIRIKTIAHKTGSVSGVTFENITLKNINKKGIVIQQDYENGSPTGTPTAGIPITDVTVKNVKGTVASKGTNVYILCAKGACSNWKWSGVSVTGGKTSSECSGIPSGSGAKC
ncbi:Endopolygalacturonase 1 [Colletotrichum fructicola]|uniref:endo-polygalacturonase n=1 Tax=Colletotrichum fructicola (strain Nara gc5) TaxID=1213859 RepID=A0A7J6JA23_COLFN|nr:Endopolygalacturonase 1 [Colletotrichum fructicola]KAE9583913.1 Endopolygalacturonase 1 [Colletotrichum fructicola]KAF4427830.1 Endopolygalacturonase 1 [Colletotrichum fructicola]KAF4486314.1 Endopolygalacturonase 1 [Colletotrichum fructicola Nara gc5]KAF4890924.1 Endopolygalacturonase 1 [Colletotrichum fructicola]